MAVAPTLSWSSSVTGFIRASFLHGQGVTGAQQDASLVADKQVSYWAAGRCWAPLDFIWQAPRRVNYCFDWLLSERITTEFAKEGTSRTVWQDTLVGWDSGVRCCRMWWFARPGLTLQQQLTSLQDPGCARPRDCSRSLQ